ncbi:hypothetical protein E2C01_013213 [Portunus trituberculatus]|uniref:Uncharacterized protein n=1 Tax=Portunus trituberculatus TaxID=210409 RepID=A0A5B7DGI0_PORTR|nr:hypothetical protein [Portunus trituberculatus]
MERSRRSREAEAVWQYAGKGKDTGGREERSIGVASGRGRERDVAEPEGGEKNLPSIAAGGGQRVSVTLRILRGATSTNTRLALTTYGTFVNVAHSRRRCHTHWLSPYPASCHTSVTKQS